MSDIDVLSRTIFGEARGEGEVGMQAVANVVMNRAAAQKSDWGMSVSQVCQKPYQFSCWNQNDPNHLVIIAITCDNPLFAQAVSIATEAVNRQLDDITNNATFYYAKGSLQPKWAIGHTPCAEIGHHIFFNDIE